MALVIKAFGYPSLRRYRAEIVLGSWQDAVGPREDRTDIDT